MYEIVSMNLFIGYRGRDVRREKISNPGRAEKPQTSHNRLETQ